MANKKNKISFGDYFIADVAIFASNPVHRVIAVCDCEGDGEKMPLFSLYSFGYENIRRHVNPEKDLYYFSLKEKLPKMKEDTDIFLAPKKTVNLEFE